MFFLTVMTLYLKAGVAPENTPRQREETSPCETTKNLRTPGGLENVTCSSERVRLPATSNIGKDTLQYQRNCSLIHSI